jgi:hypothetical protein
VTETSSEISKRLDFPETTLVRRGFVTRNFVPASGNFRRLGAHEPATSSLGKRTTVSFNYGTWVIGLLDALNVAREKLEPGFKRMSGEEVGNAVARAVPHIPFK